VEGRRSGALLALWRTKRERALLRGNDHYTRAVRTFPKLARLLSPLLVFVLAAPAGSIPPASALAALGAVTRTPIDPVYFVDLSTGSDGHVWVGTEQITFTNGGNSSMHRVWLRLWSNGVQGCQPLAIRITGIQQGTIGSFRKACTALPIDLVSPVAPGGKGTLRLSIEIHVPSRNDRFGYQRGLSLLGTSLPTLAIRDDDGWHLDPFVDLGESFYSVIGRYRVTIDSPSALDIATTGVRVAGHANGDRITATYAARHVRDFEWAAGRLSRVAASSGPVSVRVWYQPAATTLRRAKDMLHTAVASMNEYSAAFGRYPYPQVDVVLTGFATFGGMEYPTIVFTNPNRITVSHELAHQWWYGIVGDDQFTEPWLDESFATWSQYLPSDPWKNCSHFSWPSSKARLNNDMAYWRNHPSEYGTIYSGGGCMLAALAHRFGLHRFERILKRYAADHWFGIARTEEFKAAIEAAATRDLPGFDTDAFWSTWRLT
jgi:peptidase M1-like protein